MNTGNAPARLARRMQEEQIQQAVADLRIDLAGVALELGLLDEIDSLRERLQEIRRRAMKVCLSYAAAALVSIVCFTTSYAAGVRDVEAEPLAAGPFPVACSDIAHDLDKANQIGGSPSDFWEGNPQNGQPRYFTDILLEPEDTIQINPVVPNESGFYIQTWNRSVNFVVIVCYPTSLNNNRPDYPLSDSLNVPKMQRTGQKPIFPPFLPGSVSPDGDPNLLPFLVLSHGISASPLDIHSLEVMNQLASFGYIVAAPFHGDARFSLIHVGNIGDLLSVLQNFDQFVEMEALRPLSLKATVDAMLAHPDFGPHINPNMIGGFGASMGGASMTWLLGASVTDGFVSHNAHPTVQDPRIKAAVGYVPFAGESFLPAFGEDNLTAMNVNTPYLAISGTADIVAPMDRMEQAMNLFQNSHYMVALTGVQHGYESNYAGDIFGWVIPFLDAYVKGDVNALANFMQQKNIRDGLDDNVVIDFTAPMSGAGIVIEFYNTHLDHYFITADSNEAAAIDLGSAGAGWYRTGKDFRSGGNAVVCRFYGSLSPGPNSHFYTVDPVECNFLKQLQASTPTTQKRWNFESLDFISTLPSNNTCPTGTQPVYRAYNNGFARGIDANHRITSSPTAIQEVLARGWSNEGVVMCAPI